MLSKFKGPYPVSKTFYSERLVIKLTFHEKGGLDGQIYPFIPYKDISSEISGIYTPNGDNLQVGFLSGHQDHNSISTSIFTGEVLRYEANKECLIVKWVMTNDDDTDAKHADIEVLFDSDGHDLTAETIKIRKYIHSYDVLMT